MFSCLVSSVRVCVSWITSCPRTWPAKWRLMNSSLPLGWRKFSTGEFTKSVHPLCVLPFVLLLYPDLHHEFTCNFALSPLSEWRTSSIDEFVSIYPCKPYPVSICFISMISSWIQKSELNMFSAWRKHSTPVSFDFILIVIMNWTLPSAHPLVGGNPR